MCILFHNRPQNVEKSLSSITTLPALSTFSHRRPSHLARPPPSPRSSRTELQRPSCTAPTESSPQTSLHLPCTFPAPSPPQPRSRSVERPPSAHQRSPTHPLQHSLSQNDRPSPLRRPIFQASAASSPPLPAPVATSAARACATDKERTSPSTLCASAPRIF